MLANTWKKVDTIVDYKEKNKNVNKKIYLFSLCSCKITIQKMSILHKNGCINVYAVIKYCKTANWRDKKRWRYKVKHIIKDESRQ